MCFGLRASHTIRLQYFTGSSVIATQTQWHFCKERTLSGRNVKALPIQPTNSLLQCIRYLFAMLDSWEQHCGLHVSEGSRANTKEENDGGLTIHIPCRQQRYRANRSQSVS